MKVLDFKLGYMFNEIKIYVAKDLMLFGIDNRGLKNLDGKIEPEFGIELKENDNVIIDGVDEI